MATISSAFSTISQALDADQSALSIVANNVANANTTGYTREVPNWDENPPIEINGVSYGTGVTETGPTSVRDRVLDERLNQQQQLASASGTRLTALNTLQALFTPDSGSSSSTAGDIGSDITNFFDSFSSLEANPSDNSLRQDVLTTAATLAGDVSNAAASLNSQRSALDQEATGVVTQVNSLTSAIAQLNQQIQSTSPTGDAGTLEDQRQQDLSQLSQLIGINQTSTENNGLSITTAAGELLVSGGNSFQMTTGAVNGVTDFFVGTTDVTKQMISGGGDLGGYVTVRDQDIPNALSALDQLAYNISTQVNALNNEGTDYNGVEGTGTNSSGTTGTGTTPLYIFNQPTTVAGSAASMSVTMTDPNEIAAAEFGGGTGDSSNATAMANLARQSIVNGQTPSNYYSSFVSELGSTIAEVQTENTAETASVTQLQTQADSLSAVNLNDEASSMQQFERCYQAASEVFTILNTVMASALNLGVQTAVS
jgi:flagellar hook-associated protein 1 FlgK